MISWGAVAIATSIVLGVVNMYNSYTTSKAQNEQAEANKEASYRAGSYDLSTLQTQLQELTSSVDTEIYDRERQGEKDRAKILAAAGEANIAGNSLMRLQAANMLDESRDKGIYKTNLENQVAQGQLEAYKVKTEATSNANYADSQRVNPYLRTLAVGASSAADVYQTHKYNQVQGYY